MVCGGFVIGPAFEILLFFFPLFEFGNLADGEKAGYKLFSCSTQLRMNCNCL